MQLPTMLRPCIDTLICWASLIRLQSSTVTDALKSCRAKCCVTEVSDCVLEREEALNLIKDNISEKTTLYHMIAVEAVMRSLAESLSEDESLWGLTGLLHDIDYEQVGESWQNHGILAAEILGQKVPKEINRAIKAHNFERTGVKPISRMEKALIACDAISGLLVACALVMPSRKLADVRVETLEKKFRQKDFAKGVDRQRILFCEDIGVPKEVFFEVSLKGLGEHAEEIGL